MPPGSSIQEKSGLPTGNPASLLQECLAYGVLVAGARGRLVTCTPEAAALLGLPAARLQNAPVKSLPAPFPKLITEAARSGQPVTNREIRLKTSRRDAITVRASILPVKSRTQSQVVVVLNNLTSVPVFEQNMRRLDRLASLGTLSASMAHEIKNGLVAIKTFIDLLMQRGQDTELTEVVSRELQRINAIVTQMMRFAAPKKTAFATVHVHELLDHSLRLLHHQIAGKMISLQRRYQAETDAVRGDDVQLQQAFMNLLLNALEAMDGKGALTVATETMEGKRGARLMRIHIQDTGAGIARDNLERLFEPFFTTKKNGTGLGLAISQRIAHEHQGVIQVQSEINQGSTFSLLIPVLPHRSSVLKAGSETVGTRVEVETGRKEPISC
jgi:signal transduction histidine kinase